MNSVNNKPQQPVYIVDGARTPFLKVRGAPGPFHASDLARSASAALISRNLNSTKALDEVILGCVASGPDEANIARVMALRLGCDQRLPAWTVQRNCGSGLQAVDAAAQSIASGRADLILAGGTEAMSRHPILWSDDMVHWLADWRRSSGIGAHLALLARLRSRHLTPVIGLMRGLTDPITGLSMGQTAEKLAWRFDISRFEMDKFAVASHQRLASAIDGGRIDRELVPLYDAEGGLRAEDDGLRTDSSVDKLATLKPVFDRKYGKVTAGNSAQVTDGAAMLLLASEAALKRYELTPTARVVDIHWAGLDPSQMGLGPVYAMAPLMHRYELDTTDVDHWEINEAFAAQVLACLAAWTDRDFCRQELGLEEPFDAIPADRLNVDGGAISLGHPVGASGARIVLHLMQTLEQTGSRRGMAALCIGGGQGGALLLERES